MVYALSLFVGASLSEISLRGVWVCGAESCYYLSLHDCECIWNLHRVVPMLLGECGMYVN